MENKVIQNYDFCRIESKWQKYWLDQKTFKTEDFSEKPKYYILDMFPYPSGNGLHVGHVEGYTATDILARYKRMKGFHVMHPIGWDAFGLPAEQYAIKTGTHPKETTKKNSDNYRRQIQSIGFSTDWSREINTTDPSYYKWTQWIFLKLLKKGLAYESSAPVNWCPALGTVLANEEVIDGKSEVGDHPVEKKSLRQWVLKITEYAERLLQDLDDLDWPESTKEMQRHWIGKSVGAHVNFKVKDHKNSSFKVFTTRPDTLFGATFCVLAPEHPLVAKITSSEQKNSVEQYVSEAMNKSDLDRAVQAKEKTGVFTGAYALNPLSQKPIPIYIADYVLSSYGSGAIMAVPAHDERDHAFALAYNIPIERVLSGGVDDINKEAHTGDGLLINSSFLNGLKKDAAIDAVCAHLAKEKLGEKAVTYRLRDWIFSRQRYWGEPFPLSHDEDGNIVACDESELPITLPELDEYKPTGDGEPPLSRASEWVNHTKDGKKLKRETNIMPQWAGSCWYYFRYIDPNNNLNPWDMEKEKYWLPVDMYVGGVEHANLHLLYARFWHKVLYDLGYASCKEPFQRLRHPGMVLGSNGEKMSKSRGNVVSPDQVIEDWGADSLRLYEMFMGPLEQVKPWQTKGITGVNRFLKRVWKLYIEEDGSLNPKIKKEGSNESVGMQKCLHKTIQRVSSDTEELKFNTAIASMMECLNVLYKEPSISRDTAEKFLLLLAPYAPHMSEEIWEKLGYDSTLAYEKWPEFLEKLTQEEQVTVSVMVNGKFRGTIELSKDCTSKDAIESAKKSPAAEKYLTGKSIKKEIYVPGKIVNFVVAK